MNTKQENFKSPFVYERIRRIQAMNMDMSHYHNHYEIYYLLSGERNYFIENRIYPVRPGDIVLIPHEILHRTTTLKKGEHERILINADQEWIPEDVRTCFSNRCMHIPPAQRSYVEEVMRRIEKEYRNSDQYSTKLIKQDLYELLVFLTRLAETKSNAILSERQDTVIEKAAQYICEHYQEHLTLQVISTKFSMNREYFSQKFKKMTGFGFSEYLNQIRIANAVGLLNSTQLSITEIAYSCGFSDSNYFATVFKKIKGVNPKKFQSWTQNYNSTVSIPHPPL